MCGWLFSLSGGSDGVVPFCIHKTKSVKCMIIPKFITYWYKPHNVWNITHIIFLVKINNKARHLMALIVDSSPS